MPKRTPSKSSPATISADQLEQMTTHELADLLSNVVLVLRRMPNITWKELQSPPNQAPSAHTVAPASELHTPSPSHVLLREELEKMVKPDLQEIAKDLNMVVAKNAKKEDLINKILSRQSRQDGHSEQYAIQNL